MSIRSNMKEVLINNENDTFLFKIQRFALCLYFFSIHFESWDPFFTGVDFLVTKVTITFYIVVSLLRFKGIKSYISYKKFTLPIIFIFLIEMVSGYNNQHYGYTEYFSLIFLTRSGIISRVWSYWSHKKGMSLVIQRKLDNQSPSWLKLVPLNTMKISSGDPEDVLIHTWCFIPFTL